MQFHSTSGDAGKLLLSPVLITKGGTKLALYGLGNVRDEYGNVWDASWLPLRVATQRRTADGESFEVTLDWFASQTVLAQAAALRQVLQPLRPRLHRMRHSDTRGGSMA